MRYVIVGNSAAGNAAAAAIRARDPAGEIVVVSDEPYQAYYRPLMPFFIADRVTYQALFRDEVSELPGVAVRLEARVERIDPGQKTVRLRGGENLAYDRLLIATGASAAIPAIPGLGGPGVFPLRSMSDAHSIKSAAQKAARAVVIGGGRVGMKAAMALRRRGLEVAVVEKGDRLVPFQFDHAASEIVGRAIEAWGIRVFLNCSIENVERRNGSLFCELTSDGRRIEADFAVVAVGIRPNVELAMDAGATVRQGVVIDRHLQTTLPHVYAAGDVAETTDAVTGESVVPASWTSATEMGRMAGICMAGEDVEYPGTLAVLNSFLLADVPTVSVGIIQPRDEVGCEVLIRNRGDSYRKLVLKEGRLIGALMVGDIEGAGLYTALIKRQSQIDPPVLDELTTRRPGFGRVLQRALVDSGARK